MKKQINKILIVIFGFIVGFVGRKRPYIHDQRWYCPSYLGGKMGENDWYVASQGWEAGRWFGRFQAPIRWRIGAGSHEGKTMVISPIFTRCWQKVSKKIALRIIVRQQLSSNQIEDISPTLFGEWWYQSNSPEFGWITWAIAFRRAMQAMPSNRQQARWQEARVN